MLVTRPGKADMASPLPQPCRLLILGSAVDMLWTIARKPHEGSKFLYGPNRFAGMNDSAHPYDPTMQCHRIIKSGRNHRNRAVVTDVILQFKKKELKVRIKQSTFASMMIAGMHEHTITSLSSFPFFFI